MQRARSVLLILLLLAGSLWPPWLYGQEARDGPPPARQQGFSLEQNYPNPVSPETWIAFQLEETLFQEADTVTVSLRVYNVLRQAVAIPEAVDHPSGERVRIIDLPYTTPGRKIAYWDGKDIAGRRVPSGVYYYQLMVDEEPLVRKMIVLNPRRRRTPFPWFGSTRDRP